MFNVSSGHWKIYSSLYMKKKAFVKSIIIKHSLSDHSLKEKGIACKGNSSKRIFLQKDRLLLIIKSIRNKAVILRTQLVFPLFYLRRTKSAYINFEGEEICVSSVLLCVKAEKFYCQPQ